MPEPTVTLVKMGFIKLKLKFWKQLEYWGGKKACETFAEMRAIETSAEIWTFQHLLKCWHSKYMLIIGRWSISRNTVLTFETSAEKLSFETSAEIMTFKISHGILVFKIFAKYLHSKNLYKFWISNHHLLKYWHLKYWHLKHLLKYSLSKHLLKYLHLKQSRRYSLDTVGSILVMQIFIRAINVLWPCARLYWIFNTL